MRRLFAVSAVCVLIVGLVACQSDPNAHINQFWRPISEPNVLLPRGDLQHKLDFDLSQCHCGIYPANMSRDEMAAFQPDRQRLAQTSAATTSEQGGQCVTQPSMVVAECMRARGWEPTSCSGRMPLPGGGSLCASYVQPN